MTVNDLINTLVDGIRKGTISACSPVLMSDELPTFVVLDSQTDTVYITDVDPHADELPSLGTKDSACILYGHWFTEDNAYCQSCGLVPLQWAPTEADQ